MVQPQPNQPNKIKASDLGMLVNNKASYFRACMRNNYLMPDLKDSIVTYEFCESVAKGVIWLPKTENCVTAQCVDPPTKDVLAKYLCDAI